MNEGMTPHDEAMIDAAWERFKAWLPRLLADQDLAAIHEVLAVAAEKGRDPTYPEVLDAVRSNPGADARNVLAYLDGEWAEE